MIVARPTTMLRCMVLYPRDRPVMILVFRGRERFVSRPAEHERAKNLHGLIHAIHRAPFVGLVGEGGFSRAEDDRGRAAEAALQVRAVGRERDRLRRGPRAEVRRAALED